VEWKNVEMVRVPSFQFDIPQSETKFSKASSSGGPCGEVTKAFPAKGMTHEHFLEEHIKSNVSCSPELDQTLRDGQIGFDEVLSSSCGWKILLRQVVTRSQKLECKK
jgi:hypothetical protein